MKPANTVKLILALLIAAVALYLFFLRPTPLAPGEMAFYYDEANDELVIDEAGKLAPFDGKVIARVYACEGSCSSASARQIAYLEKLTDVGREVMERGFELALAGEDPPPELMDDGTFIRANTLVRKPDEDRWHSLDTRQGNRIVTGADDICSSGDAVECDPAD
ncbi:MAG: hypothetical protein AAF747_02200 [Planctomycetota bacterium]